MFLVKHVAICGLEIELSCSDSESLILGCREAGKISWITCPQFSAGLERKERLLI